MNDPESESKPDPGLEPEREREPRRRRLSVPRRGRVTAVLALVLALLLAGHRYVPDVLTLGTLLDTGLPWLGVLVVPLLLAAALQRSPLALAAALVPAIVWCFLFLPAIVRSPAGGGDNLRVVQQNLFVGNSTPTAMASTLAETDADIIGVEEVTDATGAALEAALSSKYPYSIHVSTIELWSKYRLGAWTTVNVGLDWPRALHTTVQTPEGTVSLYLAHLDSYRFDSDQTRDVGLANLGAAVHADPSKRILLLGDLNTTSTDRHLGELSPLVDAQRYGAGLGLTWPSPFPLVRIDHIMVSGIAVANSWTFEGPDSDHRGTAADLRIG